MPPPALQSTRAPSVAVFGWAGALLLDRSEKAEGRREIEELTGAGIISILTADGRRYTQIKVITDFNSDYATEKQYNQICLEYLRSSAFICGLNNH